MVTVNGDLQIIYLNGDEIASTDFAGVGQANVEGNTLRLGSWDVSASLDFSGVLDEFRIYNSSLSSNEVSVLYGGGIGDLGVVPEIYVDALHSDDNITGNVSFFSLVKIFQSLILTNLILQ